MKNLSKYTISWIVLTPTTGKATSRDLQAVNKNFDFALFSKMQDKLVGSFANAEKAEAVLKQIKNLFKEYNATIITDAQFGKSEVNYQDKTVKFPYTEKQIKNSRIVK